LSFILDNRLKADTLFVGDLPLSRVLLMNNAYFPWVILVPRIEGISELFQLTEEDLLNFHNESNYFLEAMSNAYNADKMNIASLGNIVSQLHTHVIVRYKNDEAWPSPVWSFQKTQKYQSDAAKIEIDKLTDLVDHYV
jgi:diadenosine tetraphosphate (Ap4A) HIT family hydrolase|tara:strand:+ start:1588 stop:2001 length:414 start_codon:yes stop_codon:yes gene_type:complete